MNNTSGCTFDVTFTWSGFGGRRNLGVNLHLWSSNPSKTEGYSYPNTTYPDAITGKSGTVSHTFTGVTSTSSHNVFASGQLVDARGRTIASDQTTPVPLNCEAW